MQTIEHVYEVLVRGSHLNTLAAAHVQKAVTLLNDDGSIFQVIPKLPEPCDPDNLADVLDPLIAEPLTQIQAMQDQCTAKIAEVRQEAERVMDELRRSSKELLLREELARKAVTDEANRVIGKLESENALLQQKLVAALGITENT